MAVHIENMSNPSDASTESPHAALLRRLLLLAMLMIEAAIGLAFLAHALRDAGVPAWVVVLGDSLTGLVAGFSVRWILKRQMGLLRLAAALALLVGGMLFQGWLTGWQVGLGPLEFGRSYPDWIGLGQFSLGMGVTLLALYAWQRPPLKVDLAPASPPVAVRHPARSRSRARAAAAPLPPARTKTPFRAPARKVRRAPAVVTERPIKSKRRRSYGRRPRLQFVSAEEHRCPYCLELVAENDPRGSVECKICHTLHHADCWAITGSCQVPHYSA